jgi:hypothetical protein
VFFFVSLFVLINIRVVGLPDQLDFTIQDENLLVYIDMDGKHIKDATQKSSPIRIDPNNGVIARVQYLAVSDSLIELGDLKTVFIVADVDALSKTDTIDVTLSHSDNFTFIQTWKFKNYVGNKNIALISGIYQVRYDLYYKIDSEDYVLEGLPFFIRFSANPMTSIFGVVSTLALTITGISLLKLLSSIRKSIPAEVEKSINYTKISPTSELISYYQELSFSKVQAEVSRVAFGYAVNRVRSEKCPKCKADWPKDNVQCPNCDLTLKEADELYAESLAKKALDTSKEVVESVDGLSLSDIASSLGEGITPATDIVEIITFSGLALIQPRVSKTWSKKTRSLVFSGLQTTIYSLFWFQAVGVGTVSLAMLVIAILSGIFIPIIFGKVLGDNIMEKVRDFWDSKKLSVNTVY